MASTYSTSLRLELVGDGDQSGIWGQTTNNNLGSLIEQSVTGVVTIAMVDANYTLSNFNGVVDESRNAVLVVTGTNSAIRQIICPLVEKLYVIFNNTAGSYAITIGGATGSIITIPSGVTAQVYCDGVNFFSSQTGSAGNFNINGNFTVAGTSTLVGATQVNSTLSVFGALNSTTGTISGLMYAPTAAAGTNTTQLATTAFVTTAVAGLLPSGTRVPFAQAAAPTGWTQVTDDSANNRMLRVVNTAGGGGGGSNSPILMNVVPSHTHTYSSNTGTESANHVHSGTTNGMDSNNPHSHNAGDYGHNHVAENVFAIGGPLQFLGAPGASQQNVTTTTGYANIYVDAADINHGHTFSTGGISANHFHAVSGTSDANASAANWTPRYIDMIICAKN